MGMLKCLKCGEVCLIKLHLDDCTTLQCNECDETFTLDEVREMVEGWNKALPALEAMERAATQLTAAESVAA